VTERLALAFLGTFESLGMGPTFARGRRDERAGHVRNLTISGSLVVAQVRGPDDRAAFRSRIAVRAFGASEWARVEQDLAGQARFAADLLAGRMPAGIGGIFAEAGLSLVPLSLDEVAMDCTCERWPMPCVHLAAACYALARAFEEDPFAVFAWRGRPRDELLMHLRELRNASAVAAMEAAEASRGDARSGSASVAFAAGEASARSADGGSIDDGGPAYDVDVAAFWGLGAPPALVPTGARPGAVTRPDALLDQLDPPPLAHDGRPVVDLLRPAYRALPER
jgi:uncharacterized Zn finger protein